MSVKYLRMQADQLEAKGDALYDRGQNERAQEFFRRSRRLNKEADELESKEAEKAKDNAQMVQGRLFESKYDGLDFHDEFESVDEPIDQCSYCDESTIHNCHECGNPACDNHMEFIPMTPTSGSKYLCLHCAPFSESKYDGLDLVDQFELPECDYCVEIGARRCEKCGNVYCDEHFPEHFRQIAPDEWKDWDNLAFIPCETTPKHEEWRDMIANGKTNMAGKWYDRR